MNKVQIRAELLAAFSAMVTRISENVGLKESDVTDLLLTYFATDVEAIDENNTTKFTSPKAAYLMAQKVLEDWSAAAPEALNQLEEIAAALNNDPDAFNTLKDATDGLRADITKYGLLGQVNLADAAGQNLVSTNWVTYELLPNGVYFMAGDGSAIGNSVALGIDGAASTEYTVSIRPYSDSPVVGEEARKVIRWEARQGNKVVYREVDSRVAQGTQSDWAVVSGGEQSGGSSDKVSLTDLTTWAGATAEELRGKDNALYSGYATGSSALTWLGYLGLAATGGVAPENDQVSVQVAVMDDPKNPGEKVLTFLTYGEAGTAIAVVRTVNGADPSKVAMATEAVVDTELQSLAELMALVPTLLGYKVGQVVDTLDGSDFRRVGSAGVFNETATLTFNADGTYTVTGGVGEDVDGTTVSGPRVGYWMPYGADFSSGDYQIKATVTPGAGTMGGTVTDTYSAIAGKTLTVQGDAPSMIASMAAVVTIKHTNGTETASNIDLRIANADA